MNVDRTKGNHFDDVKPGLWKYMDWLGGVERHAAIQQRMDEAEQGLMNCPFAVRPLLSLASGYFVLQQRQSCAPGADAAPGS